MTPTKAQKDSYIHRAFNRSQSIQYVECGCPVCGPGIRIYEWSMDPGEDNGTHFDVGTYVHPDCMTRWRVTFDLNVRNEDGWVKAVDVEFLSGSEV